MGFDVNEKKKLRASFMNYSGYNLNTLRKTSSKVLRNKKHAMIESGEVDTGELIVPIEYYVANIQPDGSMVSK